MGRRIGANIRKKRAERRKKRPRGRSLARFVATGVFYAGLFAAGTAMLIKFRDRLPDADDIAGLLKLKRMTVHSVEMLGTEHVTTEEIMRRSGMKLPVTMDRLKREYLYVLSRTSPWIEKVRLVTSKKGAVTIGVVERTPVALVRMNSAARVALVDSDGVCLPLDRRCARELPLVSGLADSIGECGIRRLTTGDRLRMNRFFGSAAGVDPAFLRHITQAHFSPDRLVRIRVSGCPTVITLDENDAARRLQRLMLVWEAMGSDSVRPGRIDLSFPNLAFVSTAAVPPQERRLESRAPAGLKRTSEKRTKASTRL